MSFRPLFGAFLVYARLENLESTQEIYGQLQSILKSCDSYECREHPPFLSRPNSDAMDMQIISHKHHPDWPILGPEQVAIRDCLGYVNTTVQALKLLVAVVKKAEVRVIVIGFIDQLGDTASNCCRAGGLWKACLQKLVNKLHYWKI